MAELVGEQLGDEILGDGGIGEGARVTVIAVMISESESRAAWPLYPWNSHAVVDHQDEVPRQRVHVGSYAWGG